LDQYVAFVSGHTAAITEVFEQVLLVCDQQGLLGHEPLAIDGCKMSSNAAKEWSGTLKELGDKQIKLKHQIEYHLAGHKKTRSTKRHRSNGATRTGHLNFEQSGR